MNPESSGASQLSLQILIKTIRKLLRRAPEPASLIKFFLQFLIENDKEMAPQSSEASLINFPYSLLWRAVRKLLPRAPKPPWSTFLTVYHEEKWGNCSRELRSLPGQVSLEFPIENNKEIAPESSEASLINFPNGVSSKAIRKLLPRTPKLPWSIFLTVSIWWQRRETKN